MPLRGRQSRGHRFLSPGTVEIASPDHYVEALRGAHVVVDPDARKDLVRAELRRLEAATGLRVRSEITLAGNVVTELVEALPIWLGETNTASATDTTIEVCTAASCGAGATWTPLGTSWVASARAVRLSRFGASVRITLPSGGERVRMATPIWTVDYQTRGRARLLMIDLTRGGSPTGTVSIEYTIASE